MKTLTKRLMAAALTGALLVPTLQAAEAGSRHRDGWHGPRPHHVQRDHRRHRGNNNVGVAVAAGVIGLAAGAILLGSTNRREYIAPPVNHYRPVNPYPPVTHNYRPAPAPGYVYQNVGYQPWSPAWYQYCSAKFRSFNPNTGTYTTYRGEQKFCQ